MGNVLNGLAGHRIRQKPHEIARMARFERRANFAVGFESANAGPVPRTRIDHDKWPAHRIDLGTSRWRDFRKNVIDRPRKCATVKNNLNLVVEHVRRLLFQVLTILVSTQAQGVPEQDAALRRIDHVVERRTTGAKEKRGFPRRLLNMLGCHQAVSCF